MSNECENCGMDLEDTPIGVGDILEDAFGFTIITPFGEWAITTEQALSLNAGLGLMLHGQLTRPWDHQDLSTIVSRGRRIPLEGLN